MPRFQSSSELLKERLSAIENRLPTLSHLSTLLQKCYLTRTQNLSFALSELILPLFCVFVGVFISMLAQQPPPPRADSADAFHVTSDLLAGRHLYLEANENLTGLPVEQIRRLLRHSCDLADVLLVEDLFERLTDDQQSRPNDAPLWFGVRLWMPTGGQLQLQLHSPWFGQSSHQFLHYLPDPFHYDHLRSFRFGYMQSGYLALQRCTLEAVMQALEPASNGSHPRPAATAANLSYESADENPVETVHLLDRPNRSRPIDWREVRLQPMFLNGWNTNFRNLFGWPLAQSIAVGWLFTSLRMGCEITKERRRSARDLFRLLGVRTSVYWASHYAFNVGMMLLQSLLVVGLLDAIFTFQQPDQLNPIAFSPTGYLHRLTLQVWRPSTGLLLQTLLAYSLLQTAFCALCTLCWRRPAVFCAFFALATLFGPHLPRLLLDTHLNPPYFEPSLQSGADAAAGRPNLAVATLWLLLLLPNTCLQMALEQVHQLSFCSPRWTNEPDSQTPASMRLNDTTLSWVLCEGDFIQAKQVHFTNDTSHPVPHRLSARLDAAEDRRLPASDHPAGPGLALARAIPPPAGRRPGAAGFRPGCGASPSAPAADLRGEPVHSPQPIPSASARPARGESASAQRPDHRGSRPARRRPRQVDPDPGRIGRPSRRGAHPAGRLRPGHAAG